MKRLALLLIIPLIFILSISVNITSSVAFSTPLDSETSNQSFTPASPMYITSDTDFVTLGWNGDGSPGSPYTISNLEFTDLSHGACLTISNTRSHFVVTNCQFSAGELGYAIYLSNSTNGLIEFCATGTNAYCIYGYDTSEIHLNSLTLTYTCVVFEQSWMVQISHSTINTAPGDGIFFQDCSQMTVYDVTITDCAASGISFLDTGESMIWACTIQGNFLEQIYFSGDSSTNYIYDNIIYIGTSGVRDDGHNNQWDNGVSTGNWWSNYYPPGQYNIPGSASSVDRYPRGPSTSTPTSSTTSTTTDDTTSTTTTPPVMPGGGEVLITGWIPIDYTLRVILALTIGVFYGILLLLVIRFYKRR